MSSTFQRFQIGTEERPQAEVGKRVNKYLGPETQWHEHGFESEEEMNETFQDERYKTDQEFRDAVAIMIKYSNPSKDQPSVISGRELNRALADVPSAEEAERREILNEQIMTMFGDPRYETSAIYRKSVREFIAANEGQVNDAIGNRVIQREKVTHRVQLHTGDYEATKKTLNDERVAKIEGEKKDAIARAEAYAKQSTIDLLGTPANDEGEE